MLKPYNAGHVSLAPGDVVQVEQEFAEKLILGGFAEFEPDEFDLAIERITAAHPEAVARMIDVDRRLHTIVRSPPLQRL